MSCSLCALTTTPMKHSAPHFETRELTTCFKFSPIITRVITVSWSNSLIITRFGENRCNPGVHANHGCWGIFGIEMGIDYIYTSLPLDFILYFIINRARRILNLAQRHARGLNRNSGACPNITLTWSDTGILALKRWLGLSGSGPILNRTGPVRYDQSRGPFVIYLA